MREIIGLAGSVGAALVVVWIVLLFGVSVALPFMAVSLVRNVARIRRALERIADGSTPNGGSSPGSILHV